MKNKKPMTLGKAMLYIAIAAIIFFGTIYLITSWYAMSFTTWGRDGRAFFAVTFLVFGCIAAYGWRVVMSNALDEKAKTPHLDKILKDIDEAEEALKSSEVKAKDLNK